MAKRRFFIASRHLLARAASSTLPQLPLGKKNPGKPWGNQHQGKTKTKTTPNFQWCGRNKDNTQPPRVRPKQRQRPTFKGAVKTSTTTTTKTTTKTRITNTESIMYTESNKDITNKRTTKTTTTMTKKTPNLQG